MKNLKNMLMIICLGLGMMITFDSSALDVIGGEITYTCIGKDSFLITYTYYKDCNHVPIGSKIIRARCSTTGSLITSITIPRPSSIDITGVCESSCTRCVSSSCVFPYGIEKYVYQGLIIFNYAVSCCEIIFQNTLCCYHSQITTVPRYQNYYIESRLNRCINPCNSSPKFQNDPIVIMCANKDYIFTFNAIDDDFDSFGNPIDSLSYEFTPPLSNTNTPISYLTGFSYDVPFSYWGKPNKNLPFPRGFHLDATNGNIRFRPMAPEVTVMAIKVKEWRIIDDTMTQIGEITRNLAYFVIRCEIPVNTPPIFTSSTSAHVCACDTLNYRITTYDFDTNDYVHIFVKNLPPMLSWTDNSGQVKHPEASVFWIPDSSHIRPEPYSFIVTLTDSVCPMPGLSSQVHSIYVHNKPKAKISHEIRKCNRIFLHANEVSDVLQMRWFVNNNYAGASNPCIFSANKAGRYHVMLELTGKGCDTFVFDTLDIPLMIQAQLPADTILCKGDTITLTPSITDAQGNVSYLWSTGDTTQSLFLGPLYQDTLLILHVQDSIFCHSDTMLIKVDQFDALITQENIACPGQASVLRVTPLFDEGQVVTSFFWYDLNCASPKGVDDSIIIYNQGRFMCELTNENNCSVKDSISAVYHKIPMLSFYAIPDKCLNEDDFALDSFAFPIGGIWRTQDSTLVQNNIFRISEAEAKEYLVFYDYTDTVTGCSNSDRLIFNVKDYPHIQLLSPLSYCDEDRLIDLSKHVSPQNGYWDSLHPAIVNAHFFNPHLAALVSNPLSYQVDSSNGCSNLLLIDYIINPMPEADFTADSLQGQSPLTVQFTNLSSISSGSMTYVWYFGDGDSSVLENPSHIFLNTGQYDVRLIAVSDSLCRAERTKPKFIEVFASLPDLLTRTISVYPNPAQDQLIIESSSKLDKVILYNFLGAKIRETEANNESKINLERGKLPSGLYLLKVYDKKGDVYVFQVVFK